MSVNPFDRHGQYRGPRRTLLAELCGSTSLTNDQTKNRIKGVSTRMRVVASIFTITMSPGGSVVCAEPFRNEPVDFRGIGWGAAFADYAESLSLVRQDDEVLVYVRKTKIRKGLRAIS